MDSKLMQLEPNDANINGAEIDFSDIQVFAEALLDSEKTIPDGVVGPDGLPAPKRFSVYRNNVALSLREALEETYPGVRKIVGTDNFNILSSIYFSSYPPKTPIMQAYGDQFPEFLVNFEPLQHSPFLVDLALVEKLWINAFHASDTSVLDPAKLGEIDAEQLMLTRFSTHPTAAVVLSQYQLHDLFMSRDEDDTGDISYEKLQSTQAVLISRPLFDVMVHKLDSAEAEFFKMIINNATLGESVENAMAMDVEFDASAAISLMLSAGVASGLSI